MAENFLEEQREMVIKLCEEGLRHTNYSGREIKINLGAEKTPVGRYTTARWISVKDRLPEKDVTVLGMYQRNPFAAFEPTVVEWVGNGWVNTNNKQYGTVTNWMPLPEPPKELDPAEGR